MFKNKKFIVIGIGVLLVALVLGLVAFAPIDIASAAISTDDGYDHGRGPGGLRPGGPSDNPEGLAEALGISVEELQAAHQVAQEAAVEQALAEGLITQAQADRLQNGNFRAFPMLVGPDSPIDMEAHLAEALGISVNDLSEAREAAKQAAIEQALADGKITEEQVAVMEAREALKNYVEKDALTAKALGITTDELAAAKEGGQRIPDLLEELDIDQETFQANLQAAHEEILEQAVQESLITQEQADLLLLENALHGVRGLDGRGMFPGGRDGFKHPGGFPGRPEGGGPGGTNFQPAEQSVDQG